MRPLSLLASTALAACVEPAVGPFATPDGVTLTVDGQCDLPTTSVALAGAGATDCGSVPLDGDQTEAIGCAIAAVDAGEAFYVAWEVQGIDSRSMSGWASDGAKVWTLRQDLGGEDPATFAITANTCVSAGPGDATITCGSLEPVDSEYLVCGPECTGCNPAQEPFAW